MDIYWLEQNTSNVPDSFEWLSSYEADKAASMRFVKRRTEWILGRWTVKLAFSTLLGMQPESPFLSRIEVRQTECGSPEILLEGKRTDVEVSLSHSTQTAFCVLGPKGFSLGCDVEALEPRSMNFIEDYFTADEQARIAAAPVGERARLVNILWSAKESVLKALHVGLRESTNRVRVLKVGSGPPGGSGDETWWPLLSCADGRLFRGFWREGEILIRTVVYPVGTSAQLVALQPVDCLSCAGNS